MISRQPFPGPGLAVRCLGNLTRPRLDVLRNADAIVEEEIRAAGFYPESIATDVSPARLEAFFSKEGPGYRVSRRLRQMVMFADHDLIRDPPFSRMDLITCRNVLIYLNRDVQRHVLDVFRFALVPGGWLFLGSAESVDGAGDLFDIQDKKHSLATSKAHRGDRTRLPAFPLGVSGARPAATQDFGARSDRMRVGEMHQRALEQYAPPSVIVDQHHEIMHLSERAGAYMQMSGGDASLNLVKVVLPELRADLRAILFQAAQAGVDAQARGIVFHRADGNHVVDLHVRPLPVEGPGGPVMLVLFDEQGPPDLAGSPVEQPPTAALLETEIERAKEQLHATIEQYETQNEELSASNEELQALNEELRSASEELETSKEELQSINEELVTVNQELKNKVDEGIRINDDLHNLIGSIDMGVIFLDRNLNIKRYSDRALDLFSLRLFDIGRPLMDIAHRLDYPEMGDDARHVFDQLSVQQREVRSQDGRWFATRLAPYRTADDKIEGAVFTFHEITDAQGHGSSSQSQRAAQPHAARRREGVRHPHLRRELHHRRLEPGRGGDLRLDAGGDGVGIGGTDLPAGRPGARCAAGRDAARRGRPAAPRTSAGTSARMAAASTQAG